MSDPKTPPSQPLATKGTPRIHRHGVSGLSARSKDQQQRFAHDIEWKVVGPMPTRLFIDELFPDPSDRESQLKVRGIDLSEISFASIPDSPGKEDEIYKPLCDSLNKIADPYGLVFLDTSKRVEEPGVAGTVKPDIGLFATKDENQGNIMDMHKHEKELGNDTFSYTAHMGLVYMFIEVKKEVDQDIFIDPPEGVPPSDYKFTVDTWSQDEALRSRISALGQNAHYAHVIQTRQFRTCVFSLTVSGRTARIMYWERAGVLVTKAFDYKTNPDILAEFVWRFINANPVQQGFDPTAVAVDSEEDRTSFLQAIGSHVQLQLGLDPETDKEGLDRGVDKHYYHGILTRLMVEDRSFWVSRPLVQSHAIAGRCTAGYWAVRCDTRDVVFVKDVWRANVKNVELEGDILNHLQDMGVEHIPTVLCHGDATHEGTPMTTRLDTFADRPWVKSLHPDDDRLRKVAPRVHYRLVTNIAGYPLSTFEGSRELLKATFDGFTTLIDAHDKADTLHRDVSLGNIILCRLKEEMERVGYLIDWELGCRRSKVIARDHVLTGTPAFMSIKALNNVQGHVHSLKDDLESFIYVVLYAGLRWLPVQSKFALNWWMSEFFGAPAPNGLGGGADPKQVNAIDRKYTSDLSSAGSFHVVDWLKAAMDIHYKDGFANPVWNDGKALRTMWEGVLAEDLPSNDRYVNPVPGMQIREDYSLHATYTVATSSQDLYRYRNDPPQPFVPTPAKRPHTLSAEDSSSQYDSSPKRSRPRTRSASAGSRARSCEDEDLMTGLESETSWGATDTLISERSMYTSSQSISRGLGMTRSNAVTSISTSGK